MLGLARAAAIPQHVEHEERSCHAEEDRSGDAPDPSLRTLAD